MLVYNRLSILTAILNCTFIIASYLGESLREREIERERGGGERERERER